MTASSHDLELDPHPENLARLYLAHGDGPAALEVCAAWRRRDPTNPLILALEEAARAVGHTPNGRPPLDAALADRYLRHGYIDEAFLIYQRLAFMPSAQADIQEMVQLLGDFLAFELPDDASSLQRSAEEQLKRQRVSVALAMYHEICKDQPELEQAVQRRDQLRVLLGDIPIAALLNREELAETVAEDMDTPPSQERPVPPRHRLPVRTETDLKVPSGVSRHLLEETKERLDATWIDPLDDTQQMRRDSFDRSSTIDLERKNPALARTHPSASPMVTPQDDEGRSVVELPREVQTAYERARGRPDIQAAADHAEPFGVLVRAIVILTSSAGPDREG